MEENRAPARLVSRMNSAIHYYSAAQRHADAIREARRNPVAAGPTIPQPGVQVRRRRLRWERRLSLRPLLG
jgi:hypothetical protein